MKVKELIEKLKMCDQELEVFARDDEEEASTHIIGVEQTDEELCSRGDLPRAYEDGMTYVALLGDQ